MVFNPNDNTNGAPVVAQQPTPVSDVSTSQPVTQEPQADVNVYDTNGTQIIIAAFGITGALAAMSVFFPDNALKVAPILTGVTGAILGFIAGRKKI